NYPNPFNPSTNIKFDLVRNGNVKLKVYNEIGKEVAVLLDAVRNAGSYEVKFDAANLGSGVYFYKLETDNSSVTKKMLLVK
ncbi:MAG: T9SS type A sorting domain-containing protein, partial [Ignavibacteria bacterium]|nr:T9SS type A sorting domain-containing protein [Ignavibacteria bacterium]